MNFTDAFTDAISKTDNKSKFLRIEGPIDVRATDALFWKPYGAVVFILKLAASLWLLKFFGVI